MPNNLVSANIGPDKAFRFGKAHCCLIHCRNLIRCRIGGRECAFGEEAALNRFKHGGYDIVFLDYAMPGLNGIAVARKITQVAARSKMLFISENQDPEVVREALCSGAHGYIFKSHVASELFPAIEAVLGNGTFVSDDSMRKTLLG